MINLGELCLLGALVATGYAAFACIVGYQRGHRGVGRSGDLAAVAALLALSAATGVLARALLTKDFRFAYVAAYSNRLLPWHYSLSALWVGQAGSLLIWACFSAILTVAYRFWPGREPNRLRRPTCGVLMAYLCLLVAIIVFGADPMEQSLGTPPDGAGLSPLLQHPAMLIHPPIVFLGYAGWAIPFAVAVVGLTSGRTDASWIREAQSWALFSWAVLGGGILWGAEWAYEELGWGGYWAWDPIENGSLIPWLTGTALIHAMLAWQYCGVLKKTSLALSVVTLGLCNFATFLTRSGVFSSLHAFGESTVGWMFLALMIAVLVGGVVPVLIRRKKLAPDQPIPSLWSREAMVSVSAVALLLLAGVTLVGTLTTPVSRMLLGRGIVVGTAVYNNVLIPTGLALLATTAAAPLLRWGGPPRPPQKKALLLAAGVGGVAAMVAWAVGLRHPIGLAVAGLAAMAFATLSGALWLDARRAGSRGPAKPVWQTVRDGRRRYAGYLIHLGFIALAVGVAGSSLGTRRREIVIGEGQTVDWAGRSIRCVKLIERELADKLVAEVQLEVSRRSVSHRTVSHHSAAVTTLRPAQHLHRLQREWTTEVAIDSTWRGDFYVILHGAEGEKAVSLTLIENPMMRWVWYGGWLAGAGALIGLCPTRRDSQPQSAVPAPKRLVYSGRPRRLARTSDG